MKTLKEYKQSKLEKEAMRDLHEAIDKINKVTKSQQLERMYIDNTTDFDDDGIYWPSWID